MHPGHKKGNETHWFTQESFTSSKLQPTFHLALLNPLNINILSLATLLESRKDIHRKTHDGKVVYLFLSLLTHQMCLHMNINSYILSRKGNTVYLPISAEPQKAL